MFVTPSKITKGAKNLGAIKYSGTHAMPMPDHGQVAAGETPFCATALRSGTVGAEHQVVDSTIQSLINRKVLGRYHETRSPSGRAPGSLCRTLHSIDRGDAHLVQEDSWTLNSQGSDGKCELTMSSLVAFNLDIRYDFSTTANSVFST